MVQKKPYGDDEKTVEEILLHFDKGERLSGVQVLFLFLGQNLLDAWLVT